MRETIDHDEVARLATKLAENMDITLVELLHHARETRARAIIESGIERNEYTARLTEQAALAYEQSIDKRIDLIAEQAPNSLSLYGKERHDLRKRLRALRSETEEIRSTLDALASRTIGSVCEALREEQTLALNEEPTDDEARRCAK